MPTRLIVAENPSDRCFGRYRRYLYTTARMPTGGRSVPLLFTEDAIRVAAQRAARNPQALPVRSLRRWLARLLAPRPVDHPQFAEEDLV